MAKIRTTRQGVSVWASHLSLASLPGLLSVLFSEGRFTLCYTAARPAGRLCAWMLWAMGGLLAKPRYVPFTRQGERSDDPTSATRRIQDGLNRFTDRWFTDQARLLDSFPCPDPRVPRDRFQTNLRKVVALLAYDLLVFLESARYHQEREGVADARLVILSPLAVLADAVPDGWAGEEVSFIHQRSLRQSLVLRFCWGSVRVLRSARRKDRLAPPRPNSVAVVGDWGLDRGRAMNDLFWWWESGIEANRVILFFDRPGPPARQDFLDRARALGIRCVALNAQAAGDCPELLWRDTYGVAKAVSLVRTHLRLLKWGVTRGRMGTWIAGQLSGMVAQASAFEAFLVHHNVRAVFHWNDVESDFVSLACEAAGAARVGHQWSNIHWPMACQGRLHQMYFAWGGLHGAILDRAGSCTPHVLYSGCIVKAAFPGHGRNPDAEAERSAVLAAGAERVLALFDTSLPCEGFYRFFLARVVEDSRWGLLIKPKGRGHQPWSTGDVLALESLFERALATGRVRVLDPRLSPADAAAAADVSVGVDINSATIIAALGGHRAVHLDYVPVHRSPLSEWAMFYRVGPDRVVFGDPDRLWKALDQFFDDPASSPMLGLAGDDVLRRVDPFRDGQAGRRIGEYVRWYLEALDRGLDRDQSLLDSTCRYAETWGSSMVSRGLPPDWKTARALARAGADVEVGAAGSRVRSG